MYIENKLTAAREIARLTIEVATFEVSLRYICVYGYVCMYISIRI